MYDITDGQRLSSYNPLSLCLFLIPPVPKTLISLIFLLSSLAAHAQELDTIAAGQWELGLAVGAGHKQNPLVSKGDNRYYLLPQVAYYADWGYFDNGELAANLYDDGENQLFVMASYSDDAFYFHHWKRVSLSSSRLAGLCDSCNNKVMAEEKVTSQQDHDPQWAWLGGLGFSHYGQQGFVRLKLLHDISGRHNGAFASLRLGRGFEFHGQWQFSGGFDWKSAELVDYYYGTESLDQDGMGYQGRSSIDWVVSGQWLYPLSEHLGLLVNLNSRRLGSGIVNSPLVDERTVLDSFIGITLTF
ncbi:outer membrane protein [Gallaecimonas pentaromativorans]|uniref:Outer membrane protein n=1 Tax=Gallaecimonas pentaromativorans TaxID=584787 RepID=A0A3N1NWM9_9GAMM|nr:outer membrane protein [Gallaecimonas pentaromativorans]